MKNFKDMSDAASLMELGSRIAQYRLNNNLTQSNLAKEAGVSTLTIHRIEHGQSTQFSNLIRILRELNLIGNLEALIPEPAISPIQQIKMHGKKRQRASSRSETSEPTEPWSWDDNE